MGFPILLRCHLYIESGPRSPLIRYRSNTFVSDQYLTEVHPRVFLSKVYVSLIISLHKNTEYIGAVNDKLG